MCIDTFKPLMSVLFLNDMVENEKCRWFADDVALSTNEE